MIHSCVFCDISCDFFMVHLKGSYRSSQLWRHSRFIRDPLLGRSVPVNCMDISLLLMVMQCYAFNSIDTMYRLS